MTELGIEFFRGVPAAAQPARALGFFEEARLQAYGYTLAIIYAVILLFAYRAGAWLVNSAGSPVYTDFTTIWVSGVEALRGEAARLYDSAHFLQIQTGLLGNRPYLYPNWPYPPTFLLLTAPLAVLPYLYAFLCWAGITLLTFLIVTYAIVRRPSAIALVLACPFTAWNFFAGQNGFLTGSLLGAGLLCLERQPILAGVFIGCLTYKPQFGILLPLAFIAARQWRAFIAAAGTAVGLAAVSAVAFGLETWEMLPKGLSTQKDVVLLAGGPDLAGEAAWGHIQTVYGMVRALNGDGWLAALLQGLTTIGLGMVVWQVWRSSARYPLKAATLSLATLAATPYAFSYDMAVLAVPMAFLVRDQLRDGLLRWEQTLLLLVFGIVLAFFVAFWASDGKVDFGTIPLGPTVVIAILVLVLRRVGLPKLPSLQWK